jgi:hypothetical protein
MGIALRQRQGEGHGDGRTEEAFDQRWFSWADKWFAVKHWTNVMTNKGNPRQAEIKRALDVRHQSISTPSHVLSCRYNRTTDEHPRINASSPSTRSSKMARWKD